MFSTFEHFVLLFSYQFIFLCIFQFLFISVWTDFCFSWLCYYSGILCVCLAFCSISRFVDLSIHVFSNICFLLIHCFCYIWCISCVFVFSCFFLFTLSAVCLFLFWWFVSLMFGISLSSFVCWYTLLSAAFNCANLCFQFIYVYLHVYTCYLCKFM